MSKPLQRALVWLRRDLRLQDHTALAAACAQAEQVWCAFIFDQAILASLPRRDRRVEFIWRSLQALDAELAALGARLIVRHGLAPEEVPALAQQLGAQAVFITHDDEPQALTRDAAVRQQLHAQGRALHSFKDHVVFERAELLTGGGKPYSVFTPYKNAWLKKLAADANAIREHHADTQALAPWPTQLGESSAPGVPDLAELGFEPTNLSALRLPCGSAGAQALLADFLPRMSAYANSRNFPALKGPSYLSTHLRFGTVSIRALVRAAWAQAQTGDAGASTWLAELIWRDFYHQILHHHPQVVGHAFKPEFENVLWESGPQADALFTAWCQGRTGYPLVDAAMRQLAQTGYMHNRLRMVTASFLTKDLGVDWRRGEAWFALHLNDFDLAANNGGWQWAASTGCDAQPWFRIFNPITQSEKFDADGKFIRRYVPELAGLDGRSIHAPWLAPALTLAAADVRLGDAPDAYPLPVVEHDAARQRTLARFEALRSK